jgi:hypothetical protein
MLDATAALEAALAAPAAGAGWRDGLRAALVEVDVTIRDHIAETEGDGGLLDRVRVEVPRLSNAVSKLVDEHLTLTQLTRKVVDRLDGVADDRIGEEAPVVREDALNLLAAIVRHRQRGADLLYEAYQVDVGGRG